MGQITISKMINRGVGAAAVICALLSIQGCNPSKKPTDPLDRVVIQDVVVPIGVCPKEITAMSYPKRPMLAIDNLTPEDAENFQKVARAYQQTIAELQFYAMSLEEAAYGIKDICSAVNTNNIGK